MVKIGHARISENNSVDGLKGDQTKNEVCITDWYNGNWLAVFRPKQKRHADIIATKCEDACKNDNIGYSQYSRYSLYNEVCNTNFDIKGLKKKVNCDCSSLVMTCCRSANITVPKAMATYTMMSDMMKTGNFQLLSDKKYLSDYRYLKRGDILLKSGHTAIVLTDGDGAYSTGTKIKAKYMPREFDNKLSGVKITTGNVYMRDGSGKNYGTLCVIKPNTKVRCYGFYSNSTDGSMWLYCVYQGNVAEYTGFISGRYLK